MPFNSFTGNPIHIEAYTEIFTCISDKNGQFFNKHCSGILPLQLDRITCDQYDKSYQFGEGQAAHGLVKVPDPDHMKRVQVHRIPDPYMGLFIQKAVHIYNQHS